MATWLDGDLLTHTEDGWTFNWSRGMMSVQVYRGTKWMDAIYALTTEPNEQEFNDLIHTFFAGLAE
jgi:hypothetical protein